MNKKIVIYLCLMLVILTGCKTKNVEPVTSQSSLDVIERTEQGVVGSQNFPSSGFAQENIVTFPTEQQIIEPNSVINSMGSFQNVNNVDVQNWYTFTNSDYRFKVVYPKDYLVEEEKPGTYLLTGEGVGDFYQISVLNYEESITDGLLVRASDVVIDGLVFQLEEYETNYNSTILSYKFQRENLFYRLNYEYYEGLEDMLNLFVKSAETFQLN